MKKITPPFSKAVILEDREYNYLPFIDRFAFIYEYERTKKENNFKIAPDKRYVVDTLQFVLNKHISTIITHGVSFGLRRITLPYLDNLFYQYLMIRKYLDDQVLSCEKNELIDTFKPLSNGGSYNKSVWMYQDFTKLINKSKIKTTKIEIPFRAVPDYSKKDEYEYRVIENIIHELNKKLGDYLHAAILHGSYSTEDFIRNYSDLDMILILKSNIFQDFITLKKISSQIRNLSYEVYMVDPLQHHGFCYITEADLNCYPEYLFPTVLFNYGRNMLFNVKSITVNKRDDEIDRVRMLLTDVRRLQNRVHSSKYPESGYRWKQHLSNMMLMPTYFLQAKGIHMYKKYTFDEVRNKYSKFDWMVIDEAGKHRKKWKVKNLSRYVPRVIRRSRSSLVNVGLIRLGRRMCFVKPPLPTKSRIKQHVDQSYALADKLRWEILDNI